MANVTLGDKVKDLVTGIYGIAYCRLTYLQGCDRIAIQPPTIREKGKEPIVPELFHVDEPQLVIMKKGVIKKQPEKKKKKNGGPSYFGPRTR